MRLDVRVCGQLVAKLYRERDAHVLKYLPDASKTDFVSLTMPVREEAWRWPRDLHPFFRQNLPEGFLLSVIREEFGPLMDGTDLSLLAVVGSNGIGRVSVLPEGAPVTDTVEPLDIMQLLKAENTEKHFASLVRRHARAAISGVIPKILAPDANVDAASAMPGKMTLHTQRHIIKGSDENAPYLGFNEFHTMRVLERLNVTPVASTRMSDDGRVLVVDRFDVDAQGASTWGLEDACALLGLPPNEKYATTTEKVLNATRMYLPPDAARAQLQQFGWLILTNYVVRNADCHAKNIALRYQSRSDVAFSPVFDLVTTQAYPRFASSPPALSIGGRQSWAAGKALEKFFATRLGIAPREFADMVERLCESAVEVGKELIEAARNEPRWHTVAKQMVHAWNEGMSVLRDPKHAVAFRGLDEAIAAAAFSDPEPPERPKVIGRSALMGKRQRKE
ncbi:MAG: type II toxin-antitoxin system HipA family toxin [Lautropia sp.]|nr:type II toxin-antitoxin system HipA family toxin [Lautropia sp.]